MPSSWSRSSIRSATWKARAGGSPVAMIELAMRPLEYGRACSSSDMTMWRGFCVIDLSGAGSSAALHSLGRTGLEPFRGQLGQGGEERFQRPVAPGDHQLVVGVDDPHP